jgi:hypothetical protein
VTLLLTARSGGSADRDALSGRVAYALQADEATAADHIGQPATKGLVSTAGGPNTLNRGQAAAARPRPRDKPARSLSGSGATCRPPDHEAARRMLSTVLERAQAELGA